MQRYTIAIHGGAGTILKQQMSEALEQSYRQGLERARDKGFAVLSGGGTALEAVKVAVMELEDNPLFNAGKGSVFTSSGTHEMDASIMDGASLNAGAVGAVKYVRNPILLAEKIMLQSGHVFLGGDGALDFARKCGLEIVDDDYFFSQFRFEQWNAVKGSSDVKLDHDIHLKDKKFGTVGAVACDQHGNLAAATSTGGMTNKKFGRMGDTPVIGSGTYANNRTCAISCTGNGEVFLRAVAAYDVSALIEYKRLTLSQAMEEVVTKKLLPMEGDGGMIGVDTSGNAVMLFNSAGMYRAYRSSDGSGDVAIYK